MSWIKDKKNLPKVVGVLVGVIVIAGGIITYVLISNNRSSSSVASNPVPPVPTGPGAYPGAPGGVGGYPGAPSGYPGAPGGPGAFPGGRPGAPGGFPGASTISPSQRTAAGIGAKGAKRGVTPAPGLPGAAQTAAGQVSGVTPGAPGAPVKVASVNVATGPDPFNLPKTYWINKGKMQAPIKKQRALSIPSMLISNVNPLPAIDSVVPPSNPLDSSKGPQVRTASRLVGSRRMSGVVFADNGVYAVLDTSGNSQMVQPGDRVNGGRVISIQSDGLTIRTDDNRDVKIPLASAPPAETQPTYPGGGYPGGYPGAPGGYPGAPGGYPGAPGGYPGAPGGYPGAPGGYPGAPGPGSVE